MPGSNTHSALNRAARLGLLAVALMFVAGVRHQFFWGGSLFAVLNGLETACLVGFTCLGAMAWLRGMAAVRESSPGAHKLLWLSLPMLVLAVLVPAFLTQDIVDYVMRGRIVSLHGGNPYVQMAADFPDDPFVQLGDAGWKEFPLPYGPIVADMQGAVAWLANLFSFLPPAWENLVACGMFKALFGVCLVLSAFVARSICAHVRPEDQDVAFVAILWNPLLLNEGVIQGHNEPVMMLVLLVAVHAMIVGRAGLGAFALSVGVLTKIIPVLLAPVVFVWALRKRAVPFLLLGGLGGLALLGFYWWRFLGAPGALDFIQKQSNVTGITPVWAAAEVFGVDMSVALTWGRIVTVSVILLVAGRLWQRQELRLLIAACAATLVAMVCFGLGGFRPWYHIWWVPFALLMGRGFLYRFAWWATILSPLGYVIWVSIRSFDPPHSLVKLCAGMLAPAALALLSRPKD